MWILALIALCASIGLFTDGRDAGGIALAFLALVFGGAAYFGGDE